MGTAAGGIPEYITDGETGLLIPTADVEAIVTALTRLLKNAEERHRIGENARNYILKTIHRSKIAEENEAVYKIALSHFAKRKEKAIYQRSAEQSLADAKGMFYSYHTMLYNLLYVHSWRFRIKCALKLLISSPQLVLYKLIIVSANKISTSTAGRSTFIAGLNEQIKNIEKERERLTKLELGISI